MRALTTLAALAIAPGLVLAQASSGCNNTTVSAQPVAFGNYNPVSPAPSFGLGSIDVQGGGCGNSPNPIVTIALSAGSSGNAAARSMSGPAGARLAYNLFVDAAYTQVWPALPASAPRVTLVQAPGNGNRQARVPVYARIPAGQTNLRPGAYSDLIVVEVIY
jgi:spore coat protein U-like protein